ncbi:MAG: acetyltransferase [Gammaproteobacteria bacterium]|nr:acetyltransferase [Gammaproteobacteria bacterium]
MSGLLIIGAGGHGKVIADTAELTNYWSLIVFLDDQYPAILKNAKWNVIDVIKRQEKHMNDFSNIAFGIGDNKSRLELYATSTNGVNRFPTIIHPNATISSYADIGPGTVIFTNAVVNIGAKISDVCIINTGATVDHDCVLDKGVHVSPGAHLGGGVVVGECSWVGVGASVKHGVKIGKNVIVGAGAAVVSDVPDNATVVGVPAKPL